MKMRIAAVGIALLVATSACANDVDVDDGANIVPTDSPAAAVTPTETGFLDPNTATREQLLTVPQLNPALADALIAGRPYNDNLSVHHVIASLNEADIDSVFSRVWMPIDLNSAAGDEILLIPGVGARMRHEFEEYRPYTDMAQFRREIGKYVDEAEVARLERFVMIKQ